MARSCFASWKAIWLVRPAASKLVTSPPRPLAGSEVTAEDLVRVLDHERQLEKTQPLQARHQRVAPPRTMIEPITDNVTISVSSIR